MSTTTAPARPRRAASPFGAPKVERKGNILVKWITTTDHKMIGYLYLITSFIYFCIGGVMALVIRAQLFEPGPRDRPDQRAVQPAVHDARHDHAADVRDAAVRGLRQRADAAADRRTRRRVPAPERVRLLALHLRLAHRRRRLLHARRAPPRSAGSPTSRWHRRRSRQASAATSGCSASASRASARSSVR